MQAQPRLSGRKGQGILTHASQKAHTGAAAGSRAYQGVARACVCYQCGHLEETDAAPKGPLSRPHFTQMAAILSKSQECSRHSTNATPSTSGGMRSGWWLCRARLCHLTGVEGEVVAKQHFFFFFATSCHPRWSQGQLPAEPEANTCLAQGNGAGASAPEGSGEFNPQSASCCCVASCASCPSLCLCFLLHP